MGSFFAGVKGELKNRSSIGAGLDLGRSPDIGLDVALHSGSCVGPFPLCAPAPFTACVPIFGAAIPPTTRQCAVDASYGSGSSTLVRLVDSVEFRRNQLRRDLVVPLEPGRERETTELVVEGSLVWCWVVRAGGGGFFRRSLRPLRSAVVAGAEMSGGDEEAPRRGRTEGIAHTAARAGGGG